MSLIAVAPDSSATAFPVRNPCKCVYASSAADGRAVAHGHAGPGTAHQYGHQPDRDAYIHRAWMRRGALNSAFAGRPQIAIANTASDLVPCNRHLSEVGEHVRQGADPKMALSHFRW